MPQYTNEEPPRGTLSAESPVVITPAPGVLAIVAWDNTTIDVTFEQAERLGRRLLEYTTGEKP